MKNLRENADFLWTLALCAAYRLARTQHSQTDRMVKGFTIANTGTVRLLANGAAEVESQSGPTYVVGGSVCSCPDARHRGTAQPCKHRWAVALAKKATRLLDEAVKESMGAEMGETCPACGYPTLIETAVWGKHQQAFLPVNACLMTLTAHGERYACGLREVRHA